MQRRFLARLWLRGVESVTYGSSIDRSFAVASTAAATKKAAKTKDTPKGVTGYSLFMKEAGGKLRKLGLPIGEVARQLGKEWTALSPERRQKYVDQALSYNATLHKNSPPKKEPRVNVYSLFAKAVWPSVVRDHPGASFPERSRIVASLWNNLPEEEKAKRRAASSAKA